MKHSVVIDQDLCVGCGLCAKDCVGGNIKVEDGKAATLRESCIFCGHCEAICPEGAVSLTGFEDEPIEFEQDTRLDPKELMMAIKTRRSVRRFTDEAVPKKVLKDIIEAGRLAPTGGNAQNISYYILDRKKDELEALSVGMFRKIIKAGKPLAAFLRNMEIDDQFFFKGAPLVIVIAGNDKVNPSLAAENMAFMAEAHGLGVFYSGFFTMCANSSRKIKKIMKFKKGHKAVTTLVIGYPDVKYRRTVRREKADIHIL